MSNYKTVYMVYEVNKARTRGFSYSYNLESNAQNHLKHTNEDFDAWYVVQTYELEEDSHRDDDSEVTNAPDNTSLTPTDDGELRELINSWIPMNVKDPDYVKTAKVDARVEFMNLIHQYGNTRAVEARIDEQQRTFIGCTKPTIEIWFEKDGNGHPSITKDDRIVELQASLTPKEKSGE